MPCFFDTHNNLQKNGSLPQMRTPIVPFPCVLKCTGPAMLYVLFCFLPMRRVFLACFVTTGLISGNWPNNNAKTSLSPIMKCAPCVCYLTIRETITTVLKLLLFWFKNNSSQCHTYKTPQKNKLCPGQHFFNKKSTYVRVEEVEETYVHHITHHTTTQPYIQTP